MFWDTHAHINMLSDPHTQVAAFREHNIQGCICPAVDYESSLASIQLAKDFPGIVGSAVGIHPNEQEHPWDDFVALAENNALWAIGETGLDYYRDSVPKKLQKERFARHIELAKAFDLPLIIHVRQASSDVIDMIDQHASGVTTILHSFTESTEVAKHAIELGCYISLSGIITFKNAGDLRETAATLPINRILVETDTPYLTPEPFRGRENHPKHVIEVARVIATLHQIPLDALRDILLHNTKSVFTKISAYPENEL